MRWLLLIVLAACGPKPVTPPDPDAPIDPPIDTPVSGCAYTEQRDTTNDDVPPAMGTPEDTGITFAQRAVVCGSFAADHFDGDITVDVDGYLVTLDSAADVLVRIHGAGAEDIELVGLDVYGGTGFDQLVKSVTFYGDHGVSAMHLDPGTYELAAFALAGAAITAPVDYQLTLEIDSPSTRCPAGSGGFPEAGDGGNNTGNDMVTIPSGAPPALTSGNDTPEATGLTIQPDSMQRVTGSLADVAVADQYEDKDTFAFSIGQANELAVRLDWTAAANLDYLLFEENNPDPVKRAIAAGTTAPEYETFAVKRNTSYWLLIGAKVGGTLPATYGASLCGTEFVP